MINVISANYKFSPSHQIAHVIKSPICKHAITALATYTLLSLCTRSPLVPIVSNFYNRSIGPRVEAFKNVARPLVYKCALTVLVGVGQPLVTTILFKIAAIAYKKPFLMNSRAYVPIPSMFVFVADCLVVLSYIPLWVWEIEKMSLLHICLAGPIVEELIYRLALQELLLKRKLSFAAKQLGFSLDPDNIYLKCSRVFLSSMIFTVAHPWTLSRDPNINPWGPACFPIVMITSLTLGAAQEITGKAGYPIALHIINNSIRYIALQLAKKM